MKHLRALLVAAVLLSSGAVAVADVGSTLIQPQPGQSSPNVEHVATVPLEAGTWVTGTIHEGYLYVNGNLSFSIFDISEPTRPVLMSKTPVGQFNFVSEDPDTNGEILILSDERTRKVMQVWDVRDKRNPKLLSEIGGMLEHTMECILDCTYAFGPGGAIVDLRNPAAPVLANRWRPEVQPGFAFDSREVSPGRVVVAARTMKVFDTTKDPARPLELASTTLPDNRVLHSAKWPRDGKDRFLLVQGETSPKPQCDALSGAMHVFDTTDWREKKTFKLLDEFRIPAGTYIDGNPPASALGCSATWFTEHPSFRNGGIVAGAYFDHGTRFLRITREGQIEEVGYFTPAGGSTLSTLWVTDQLVYAIDISHGIDILRFTGDTSPKGGPDPDDGRDQED